MTKKAKNTFAFAIILLTSLILLAGINAASVFAQDSQATVNIVESLGGATDPGPGSHNYDNASEVVLTATPETNFVFLQWLISADTDYTATNNPFTLTVAAGTTYNIQPVFQPTVVPFLPYTPPLDTSAFAIIEILASVGGTTNPPPGFYSVVSAEQVELRAVAAEGFVFQNWVVSGSYMPGHGGDPSLDTNIPTDNPLLVGHGEGYQYTYQAVFIPIGATPPSNPPTNPPATTSGISTELLIAIVAIVIIVVALIAAFAYMKRGKK
jgi:hypothetical protein